MIAQSFISHATETLWEEAAMMAVAIRVAQPKYVLVMGVCGVGKSTIAQEVAALVGGTFVEADDHHSAENKQAMIGGKPLTDDMRWPWLTALAGAAAD